MLYHAVLLAGILNCILYTYEISQLLTAALQILPLNCYNIATILVLRHGAFKTRLTSYPQITTNSYKYLTFFHLQEHSDN